jgi:hypothetical protein
MRKEMIRMTIEQLKAAIERIQPTNAINRATRLALLERLYALMAEQGITE